MSKDNLLINIARCESAMHCRSTNDKSHPCFDIVNIQQENTDDKYCIPEPWSGEISKAKVLFVSSNPSIGSIPTESPTEIYPTTVSPDEFIIEFFNGRFGNRGNRFIENGIKCLLDDGNYSKHIAFWSAVKARAREIFKREVHPGIDYALTEVVHCKSQGEVGVGKARKHCTEKYLREILDSSAARLIVVLGAIAKKSMCESYRELEAESRNLVGPLDLAGRERMVLFAPHPNARVAKKLSKILTDEELASVCGFVRESKLG